MPFYTCSARYENRVREKYFDILNHLSPLPRAKKWLSCLLEELPLHLEPEDRFFGWFGFETEPESQGTPAFSSDRPFPLETQKALEELRQYHTTVSFDRGHVCADYESILKNGLGYYLSMIEKELEGKPGDSMLSAMRDALLSVKAFCAKLSRYAASEAEKAEGEAKARFLAIAEMLRKVPFSPAETFSEAIQAVWLIHFLIPLSNNAWFSISLGRFDRYMLPYYRKAIKEGVPQEEIKAILYQFYQLLNHYADAACAMNVGGESEDGEEYNELSYLLIECQKEFSFPAPILTARISKDTPDSVFDTLIDDALFSRGQPTFYSEENCASALIEKGVPPKEAKRFSNNSCMGFGLPGRELNSMWGCVFNVPAVLEEVLTASPAPTSVDEIFTRFEACAGELMDKALLAYEKIAETCEYNAPDLFLSAITESCIKKASDRVSGVDYHNVTVETAGLVNASDGITAIDKLVFREKKYSLEEINAAVKAGFEGYAVLRADLLSVPKYGEDKEEADRIAVRLSELMIRLIRKHDHKNYYFLPSLHSLDANVGWGAGFGAGYDGRAPGAPFAKNAGPGNAVRKKDPTAVILSASRLPQTKFYGGQPIDLHFESDTVKKNPAAIREAIRVYFARGGLQLQVNSLSSALLRKAYEEPENYAGLVVRIGGYSIRFNALSERSKLEFIERFEKEES